jgi:N-acyl-D-amino-acid deacylase
MVPPIGLRNAGVPRGGDFMRALWPSLSFLLASCASVPPPAPAPSQTAQQFDLIIRGGTIVDGSGGQPFTGDVGISGDRIVAVAPHLGGMASRTIDATGLAVAPGFVNMLSWANDSLVEDGASESDIRQGVTLEVMGEGDSEGPYNDKMIANAEAQQVDIKYPISWRSLRGYWDFLEKKGIAPNVASFVGASQVRTFVLGEDDVDPTPTQLAEMQNLVRAAMNEGAMGVGSSLIYAPATFAETPELIALATASAQCGGMYISHMRNESDHVLDATDELIAIARASGGPAEIYHMKQAGTGNWDKQKPMIDRIEAARAQGIRITADMYTYTAGATGLDAAMPPWVRAGGYDQWRKRLLDPVMRKKVIAEMKLRPVGWDSLYFQAGGPDKVLFLQFKNPALKKYTGMTLAQVAKARGTSPEDTAIDLVIEDGTRVGTAYFLMSEENVARQTALPWMSFGSDASSQAPRGKFLLSSVHPRTYGNFSRLLGKYVRDEKKLSLAEAVRKLSYQPASNLGIKDRGMIRAGMHADLAIFDPAKIADTATFDKPQQFAVGMRDVLVNGQPVLLDGQMALARPGRAVTGPGTGRCPPK